jgi:hypothetical protein
MEVEILALRHQLAVLQRPQKRVSLGASDRLLWVILSRFLKHWRSALVISQTGNSNWVAPKRIPFVLALEE